MSYVSHVRLYINQMRTRIVPEDSQEAAFLLCAAGSEVSDADMKRYGLPAKPVAEPEAAPDPEPEAAVEPSVIGPSPATEPEPEPSHRRGR